MPALNQKVAVSVVFVAAMFMSIMDTTIVNVALPTIAAELRVSQASVASVAVAYLVSLAVFIPASGWLGDRFGSRRVFLIAVVVFTLASAACGLAGSIATLVGFRILQGVGGGMLAPVGMTMLYRTFPPAERVRASAILTVPTTLAPALGPVIGGLLVTDLSWRWVFYVNVPVGIATVIFGLLFLVEQRQAHPGRFDVGGFVLAGAGLGLAMYGISEGSAKGWGSTVVVGTIGAGAVLLAALIVVERRTAQPMIDLAIFSDRLFRSTTGVLVLASVAFLGVLFVVPLFFQDGRGLNALGSGLSTFPEAVGVMVGAQFTSRILYPAVGPRRLMAAGLTFVAATMVGMAAVGGATSLWWMRLLLFAMGFGMAQVFVPSQAAAFATISPAATGRASTLFNAQRQLGAALGVAVLSTVLAAVGTVRFAAHHPLPSLTAYHDAFLVAAAVAVGGAVLALSVHDRDAAATMVPRRRRPRPAGRPAGPHPGTPFPKADHTSRGYAPLSRGRTQGGTQPWTKRRGPPNGAGPTWYRPRCAPCGGWVAMPSSLRCSPWGRWPGWPSASTDS